jgi:triosephosphate isomerase
MLTFLKPTLIKLNAQLGAQDCAGWEQGAYTGEVSASLLQEVGCDFTLIGHSERRSHFNEQGSLLKNKIEQALSKKLAVIYCIGETLEQRKGDELKEVLESQLSILKALSPDADLIVAYEPVWAIGTGLTATITEIQDTHELIKNYLGTLGLEHAPLLYGGSVNPALASELSHKPFLNGLLVGSVSQKPKEFAQVITNFIS